LPISRSESKNIVRFAQAFAVRRRARRRRSVSRPMYSDFRYFGIAKYMSFNAIC
jgi:hypothetical protein